jgi:hypothetical protein
MSSLCAIFLAPELKENAQCAIFLKKISPRILALILEFSTIILPGIWNEVKLSFWASCRSQC